MEKEMPADELTIEELIFFDRLSSKEAEGKRGMRFYTTEEFLKSFDFSFPENIENRNYTGTGFSDVTQDLDLDNAKNTQLEGLKNQLSDDQKKTTNNLFFADKLI